MNISTTYLGLKLRSPLVASSGPLQSEIDNVRRMEEAGVSAVVLHSLFEEQIEVESMNLDRYLSQGADSYGESLSYFPDLSHYNIGTDGYLEYVYRLKRSVGIPVIASLNGISSGGWIRYARWIEQAGADALELNIYSIPTDAFRGAAEIEQEYVDLVSNIRDSVRLPLAVKLAPFFSALPHTARRLEEAGAGALVLFNRFYQPDYDLDELDVKPHLTLSTSQELPLRLHWTAILHGAVGCDIAVTGGVHSGEDVLKCIMAGATVAMTTSCLLRHGISFASRILNDMVDWMESRDYESVDQMRGSMSRRRAGDPGAYERGNYMKVLSSYALRRAVS
jgi:dihydroorotate dehydrogenase (fumarate)